MTTFRVVARGLFLHAVAVSGLGLGLSFLGLLRHAHGEIVQTWYKALVQIRLAPRLLPVYRSDISR